jgi:hypothetical protein
LLTRFEQQQQQQQQQQQHALRESGELLSPEAEDD